MLFLLSLDSELITKFLCNARKKEILCFFFLILTTWEHLSTEWYGSHWYTLLMWLYTAWGDIFLKLEVHSFKNFYRDVHWGLIVIIFFKFKNTALHFLFLYFLTDKVTVVMPYNAVSIGHMYKTYPKVPEKLSWVFQSGRGFILVWYSGIWLSCCDILPCCQTEPWKFLFHYLRKGLKWHPAYAWLNLVSGITGELYINRAEASVG